MSTLAQLETRVSARLVDAANAVFALTTVDEGLRAALDEYNQVAPLGMETNIILPGVGREIALNNVSGLLDVLEVWWPYGTGGVPQTTEIWPPNRVKGFQVWWDDAQPVLFLTEILGDQPQLNDVLRLWYTKPHTIQNLDSAAVTTLPATHEGPLVTGAAGLAAVSEMIDQAGSIRIDQKEYDTLRNWSKERLAEFRAWLEVVRRGRVGSKPPGGPAGSGWTMDKWDSRDSTAEKNF